MVDPIPWGNLSGEDMETLLAVFICKQRPEANRVRPSSGDNGIDLQVKNGDGTYDVYQVKKFAHTLKTSQKSQIKKSLKSLTTISGKPAIRWRTGIWSCPWIQLRRI